MNIVPTHLPATDRRMAYLQGGQKLLSAYTTGRMHNNAKVEKNAGQIYSAMDRRKYCIQKSRISHTRLLWWSWNLVGRRPKRKLSITPFDTLTWASSMTELPLVQIAANYDLYQSTSLKSGPARCSIDQPPSKPVSFRAWRSYQTDPISYIPSTSHHKTGSIERGH